MNKVVRRHFPAAKLPEELRDEIAAGEKVTVTIEVEDEPARPPAQLDWFSRFEHLRRNNFASFAEVDAHIRGLRDEWGHRER